MFRQRSIIAAVFNQTDPSSTHIALRWSASTNNIDFYSHCEAISRLWREEVFIRKDISLLQRSNMSIEKTGNLLALQRSAM